MRKILVLLVGSLVLGVGCSIPRHCTEGSFTCTKANLQECVDGGWELRKFCGSKESCQAGLDEHTCELDLGMPAAQ